MGLSYFKRFRMEIDLRERSFAPIEVPPGYRLLAWEPSRLIDHAEAKFHSFRDEVDASIFSCLGHQVGCHQLMEEISDKDGFLPEATWLAAHVDSKGSILEYCGTIQGIRASSRLGAVQNIGITPAHRCNGVGTALVYAALEGFQQVGLPRAYLEVTAQNESAVRLYKRLGFHRTRTLYKAVELEYA